MTGTGGPYDVAVVGAGIVGLGHAAAALQRGLRVIVIERSASIVGATVRNFGHIGVGAHTGEAGELAARSRELWLGLAERAGFWTSREGALVVARHEDELAMLRDSGAGAPLGSDEVARLTPVLGALGGSHLPDDLQVDPREAGPAIAAHLAAEGVAFAWRTSALGAEDGVLHTSRGPIRAESVVFAVGHDVDHLFPDVADEHGLQRCRLDMLMAEGVGLALPLLTGTSMLRYSSFASSPAAAAVRRRYAREEPGLVEYDVNQMFTERPDGSLLVGDTHTAGPAASPFQDEAAFALLHRLGSDLLGRPLRVRQRWQGVYATAPRPFLRAAPADGVRVVSVTAGSGMTCGLALAESVIAELWD